MDGLVEEVELNFDERTKGRPKRKPSLDKSLGSLSMDEEFENDPWWKTALRYIAILPPGPGEDPIKRKIRLFIWTSLSLEFLAGVVSIATFDGAAECCGQSIFGIAADMDWTSFIKITTYVYLSMLFLEIFPIFRKGLPFNLVNPLVGFTITVTMFFDDRILEAVTMWSIEAMAVLFETMVYRLKYLEYKKVETRIKECTEELDYRKKSRRGLNDSYSSDTSEENDRTNKSDFSFGGNKQLDTFRVERERRHLQNALSSEEKSLHYHFVGTIVNLSLVFLSLSLIVAIGRNGGLCVYHGETPDPFASNQLEKCNKCPKGGDACEICDPDGGNHQCYFPYL